MFTATSNVIDNNQAYLDHHEKIKASLTINIDHRGPVVISPLNHFKETIIGHVQREYMSMTTQPRPDYWFFSDNARPIEPSLEEVQKEEFRVIRAVKPGYTGSAGIARMQKFLVQMANAKDFKEIAEAYFAANFYKGALGRHVIASAVLISTYVLMTGTQSETQQKFLTLHRFPFSQNEFARIEMSETVLLQLAGKLPNYKPNVEEKAYFLNQAAAYPHFKVRVTDKQIYQLLTDQATRAEAVKKEDSKFEIDAMCVAFGYGAGI